VGEAVRVGEGEGVLEKVGVAVREGEGEGVGDEVEEKVGELVLV